LRTLPPPSLGSPKLATAEPTEAGQAVSSLGGHGRPGGQGDQPGPVQGPGPPAHGQVVGQDQPPGPVQWVGGGGGVHRPGDPPGGAPQDPPHVGPHPPPPRRPRPAAPAGGGRGRPTRRPPGRPGTGRPPPGGPRTTSPAWSGRRRQA